MRSEHWSHHHVLGNFADVESSELTRLRPFFLVTLITLTLTACARAGEMATAPDAPGFLLGLWHGFIFPVAWVISLFVENVAIYAVPNNGGWYDFGYFLGIVVFGVGARRSTKVVYREVNTARNRDNATIIDHE
jgi:hypothetical protein